MCELSHATNFSLYLPCPRMLTAQQERASKSPAPVIPPVPTRIKSAERTNTRSPPAAPQNTRTSQSRSPSSPSPTGVAKSAAVPNFVAPHESKCNCCFRNFTFTTRRHHCRCCNRAVCHSCSGMRESTERMRALTSTPFGELPEPALLVRHQWYLVSVNAQLTS